MTMVQRNGQWVADYYSGTGKRVRRVLRGASCRRDAERLYRQLLSDTEKQHDDPQVSAKTSHTSIPQNNPAAIPSDTQQYLQVFIPDATGVLHPAILPRTAITGNMSQVTAAQGPNPQPQIQGNSLRNERQRQADASETDSLPGDPPDDSDDDLPVLPRADKIPAIPIRPFICSFLRHHESSCTEGATIRVEGALRNYTEKMIPATVRDLTPENMYKYIEQRRKEVTPRTVNIEITALKGMLNWAKKARHIPYSPLDVVDQLREGEERKIPRKLSDDEMEKLLREAGNTVYGDIIKAFLHTGMRHKELGFLRWCDVSFEEREIHLRSHPARTLKTHNERIIPMNDVVMEVFHRWKERTGDFEYVFATPKGKPRLNNLSGRIADMGRKAGIDGVSPHIFRHTFASNLVAKGVDIFKVKKLLGHQDISTTQIYLHHSTDDLRAAVEKL